MLADVRQRLADLVGIAEQIGAALAAPGADQLPGLVLCRLGVAVDEAASRLGLLADQLRPVKPEERRKSP